MDAQQFLAEFGHMANAPDGVARLRDLVYSLASEGTLLGDEAKVEPVHLDRVAAFVMGQAPPGEACNTTGEGVVFVKTGEFGDLYPVAREWTTKPLKFAQQGDVLICVVGATVGKLNLAIDCAIGRSVAAIRPRAGLLTKYLYSMLMPFTLRLRRGSRGSAQGVIGKAELSSVRLRVPSEAEQSRIVAKVDELMALCDQLEQQQQDRRKLQIALRQSTLQALASAQNPHEMKTSWQRLQASFGSLFQQVEDVKDMRALILDLAFAARLSSAQAGDEQVEDFLKRNREAKAKMLATGEMKRKASAATDVVQLEVELPAHWAKVPLEELFQFIDYRGQTPTKTDSGVVLITAKNVRPGRLEREPIEYISEKSYSERMTRGFPKVGDILFTTEAPLGNVALIEAPPNFALAQRVIDLQPFADMNSRCAMYLMMSPIFQTLLDKNSSGMTAKGIKAGKLKQLELPVPPPSEQARIIARVDQLMQICDDMETQLRDAERTASRLAIASVAALTGIAIEHDEETAVKAPQTELISRLRLATPPDVRAQAPLATILARHQGEMAARDLWQRFGGDIDAFYAQLKAEVAHGWITEPAVAEVRTKPVETAGA